MQPSRPPPFPKPLTVLCVDDRTAGLLIRKTLLEQAGYRVLCAASVKQALRMYETNPIDVIVSDHHLGDGTGTELARQLKRANPEVPIVLLSGLADQPAGIEQVDQFLDKMEGPEKLLAAIAAVTGQSTSGQSSRPFIVSESRASAEGGENCAATMAHEIKNPLESLLNLLYLVDAEPAITQKGHHHLALAREEVMRMSQLTRAALHESKGSDDPEDTNVPDLLCSVIDLYKATLEVRRISVSTVCCPDGNLAVYPGPLRQLFSNLLLNAADAMAKGGRLHLRVAKAREWSGQQRHGLRVTFADNGCGIPAQNLQQIFEPFFTTKGAGGSGLGLSLVKDVVQKHGGSLRVRSSTKSGHSGSVFAIFLPRDLNGLPTVETISPGRA